MCYILIICYITKNIYICINWSSTLKVKPSLPSLLSMLPWCPHGQEDWTRVRISEWERERGGGTKTCSLFHRSASRIYQELGLPRPKQNTLVYPASCTLALLNLLGVSSEARSPPEHWKGAGQPRCAVLCLVLACISEWLNQPRTSGGTEAEVAGVSSWFVARWQLLSLR